MKPNSITKYLEREAKTITIEPVILLFIFGFFILYGSQVPVNILIFKICRYEMGHSQDVCDNLGDEANADIQTKGWIG